MFLTMLDQLEGQGLLSATSEVANLDLIMGLFVQLMHEYDKDYGLLDVDKPISPKADAAASKFIPLVRAYSKKHDITLKGSDTVADLASKGDDAEIPEGCTGWDFWTAYKKYEKDCGKLGGDSLDITTWKPKDRRDASFDGKDPLSRAMLKDIKEGMVMQLA